MVMRIFFLFYFLFNDDDEEEEEEEEENDDCPMMPPCPKRRKISGLGLLFTLTNTCMHPAVVNEDENTPDEVALEKKQQALKRNSRGFCWLCNRCCSNLGNGATIFSNDSSQPSKQTAYTYKHISRACGPN
ncbi:hypothetical protein T4D_13390 [Trichinella pseudospiralis]|uniref:Uncharacterized protein n=1 Tax=Trichinella pseudospiralis TaxID=6337 RepID=A0A0V1FTH0_TRIPS|nr:hypothetical protein T4D_13390 [Trichinella pseudospiralis]